MTVQRPLVLQFSTHWMERNRHHFKRSVQLQKQHLCTMNRSRFLVESTP